MKFSLFFSLDFIINNFWSKKKDPCWSYEASFSVPSILIPCLLLIYLWACFFFLLFTLSLSLSLSLSLCGVCADSYHICVYVSLHFLLPSSLLSSFDFFLSLSPSLFTCVLSDIHTGNSTKSHDTKYWVVFCKRCGKNVQEWCHLIPFVYFRRSDDFLC